MAFLSSARSRGGETVESVLKINKNGQKKKERKGQFFFFRDLTCRLFKGGQKLELGGNPTRDKNKTKQRTQHKGGRKEGRNGGWEFCYGRHANGTARRGAVAWERAAAAAGRKTRPQREQEEAPEEAVTHVKSSINRPTRCDSSVSGERPSSSLCNLALPWTTFGQASPPCPSTPFEIPPQAHSESVSERERMRPPPPPLVTSRTSYVRLSATRDGCGCGCCTGPNRSRLNPA
jgi:hypothetical protein